MTHTTDSSCHGIRALLEDPEAWRRSAWAAPSPRCILGGGLGPLLLFRSVILATLDHVPARICTLREALSRVGSA